MPGIDAPDVQHRKRQQRCYREYAETHNERINDGRVALWISGGQKQHYAEDKHKPTHFFKRGEEQCRDFSLGRMQEQSEDKGLARENENHAPNDHHERKETQYDPQRTIGWI
jgi:hypothetical protein